MRLTGSRAYYRPSPPKMPPGLVELMEGLTKNVLRHNPSDVYGFCAGHVQQLLVKRDGPSLIKPLSLEDKIERAQKKVRQRAEIRRQEYDKNFLKQQQSSNDINDEIILHVPQLIIAQESRSADNVSEDNVTSSREDLHNVHIPIPHENALENLSDIADGSCNDALAENSIKTNCINDISTLKEENNISTDIENVNAAQSNNESNNNENIEISSNKIPDTDTTNHVDNDLDSNKESTSSDKSLVTEHLDEIFKGDMLIKDVESNQQMLSDLNSDQNVAKAIEEVEVVTEMDNDKKTNNIISVNHDLKQSGIEIAKYILVTSNDDDHRDANKTDNIQVAVVDRSENAINIQKSNTAEKVTSEFDKIQHSNTSAIDAKEMSVTHDKSLQETAQDSQTVEVLLASHPAVTPALNIVEDTLKTKNDDVETNNTEATEISSELGFTPKEIQIEKTDHETELKEPINIATSETETRFDLPPSDIDKDITTLVTENTGNDANELNELKNVTSDINAMTSSEDVPVSRIDTVNADLDKVTSNNEDDNAELDTKDNSTNAIVNFSSASTHSTEEHNNDISKGESINNMSENVQSDNHDPGNMDLETAAITIQKVFRTFLFKSRGSTFEDTGNDEANFMDEDDKNKEECDFPIASALNIDRRAHGITRMDTVLQTVNEEKSLSLSDDSSTLSSAATIIQAHVRGFLVRNKLNSYKTVSTNSLAASNSNDPSITSLEADNDHNKSKTVLNIHIVPEGDNYFSRDESLITSMELSLDSSPPSSINLHPLGYDKSERRKQLKREDAIQSISPPSNHSGKLSEDFDSVKELSLNDHDIVVEQVDDNKTAIHDKDGNGMNIPIENNTFESALKNIEDTNNIKNKTGDSETRLQKKRKSIVKMSSDEMDVVSPFIANEDTGLIHSGEFHDAVLPTRVSRSDTSVVSEFKNVLVYFLLWNHSL